MAKIKINFNDTDYQIDESALTSASNNLKRHFSTAMAGTGATVKLGDSSYNIDSTKLTTATNSFISRLGTLAGSGSKVIVGGVEYGIDSNKVQNVFDELNAFFENLSFARVILTTPGLYEAGAIEKCYKYGLDAVEGMMVTSWDDLIANGDLVVNNGALSVGVFLPELPAKNQYGFYYGVRYLYSNEYNAGKGWVLYQDGSAEYYDEGEIAETYPAGTAIYSNGYIDLTATGRSSLNVYSNGQELASRSDSYYIEKTIAQINGDLVLPGDEGIISIEKSFHSQTSLSGVVIPNGITSVGFNAFYNCSSLTYVIVPDSVTSIGGNAFFGCSNLTSITIPDGVTSISYCAFQDCTSLTSIIYKGTIAQWNQIELGSLWITNTDVEYIQCSDGQVAL